MTIERRVLVHQDRKVLALAVATRFLATVGGIVAAKGEANIALTGGVRYKVERDQIPALADTHRDSKAVYVGTAFKF